MCSDWYDIKFYTCRKLNIRHAVDSYIIHQFYFVLLKMFSKKTTHNARNIIIITVPDTWRVAQNDNYLYLFAYAENVTFS